MKEKRIAVFSPDIPADLERAPFIREEALDWLETHYPAVLSFVSSDVLRMAGERNRRWLITRLRARDIGNEAEFSLPDTADALTVLFLRSKGVKFRDAVDAVVGRTESLRHPGPGYGGVWNRLRVNALESLGRRIPARLLASVVFALLHKPDEHINCLVIVKHLNTQNRTQTQEKPGKVTHDYVYRMVLERPSPWCAVVSPSREVMFFSEDQLPARSEITSRHFCALRVDTAIESYELLMGTMKPAQALPDSETMRFVSRVLDIVFSQFDKFLQAQIQSKLDTPVEPEEGSASDLQLWGITQFISGMYPGSLCEISEMSTSTHTAKVLASSVSKPWEPSPWEPIKSLEMLSGYASETGVPLIVEKVENPLTLVIEGVETELRYLRSKVAKGKPSGPFSALAFPVSSSFGNSMGALYVLMPSPGKASLDTEVRILSVFSRIIGETIERHRAAAFSAEVSADIVSSAILDRRQFKSELLELLNGQARVVKENAHLDQDVRLPFILVSAHSADPNRFDVQTLGHLKNWLVDTLHRLEWHSFLSSRISVIRQNRWRGFMGDVPGIGIMIALGSLVSKDELDYIRNAFPTALNRTSPTNSPVKIVSWVLDVPAQHILDAAKEKNLPALADKIEGWSFDVATLVDDLAQSSDLRDKGEWDAALKKIRQALQKPGAHNNSYLRRLAVDCSLALADWPGALKYAQEAVALSGRELGSGLVRSLCMEGDAYLCLGNPEQALDLYSEAALKAPAHPLPKYYRGQSLLLMARLLRVYEDEQRRIGTLEDEEEKLIQSVHGTLTSAAIEDLTSAADLLDKWGLIPEMYQYRNFHLVPTLLGQGMLYLLDRSPGPAASRLQSARRSFPKDDLFFREFLFAKCWERGVHRQYAALLLSEDSGAFVEKLLVISGK